MTLQGPITEVKNRFLNMAKKIQSAPIFDFFRDNKKILLIVKIFSNNVNFISEQLKDLQASTNSGFALMFLFFDAVQMLVLGNTKETKADDELK